MFVGIKQSFCFLNWQRAKVLLKLEFDTKDQVLYYYLCFVVVMIYIPGIIISGGYGARTSVEVFNPSEKTGCLLPSLPTSTPRWL